jgi:O-antigen/teichoic acid export membrane protein
MVFFGPLGQIALRFYSICKERAQISEYARVLKKFHLKAVVAVILLSLFASAVAGVHVGGAWMVVLGIAGLFGILSGVFGSLQSVFAAMRERRANASFLIADAWLRPLIAFAFIVIVAPIGSYALAGYSCATALVVVLQLGRLRRDLPLSGFAEAKRDSTSRLEPDFLAYGLPIVAFAGFAVVSQYADRWILQGFWGEHEVGIYAALYQVASAPVVLMVSVITQLVVPVVFARAGALSEKDAVHSSQRLLFWTLLLTSVAFGFATLIAFLFGEEIVGLLTNRTFAGYGNSLWIIVLALAAFNIAQLMSVSGFSVNNSRVYFWPKFSQAATLVIAGYFLARSYAVSGMASALLVSSLFYLGWVWVVTIKLHKTMGLNAFDLAKRSEINGG